MARLMVNGRDVYLGRWPSRKAANVAIDRHVLHLGLDRPLRHPAESRKRGPASVATLVAEAHAQVKASTSTSYRGVCPAPRGLWRVELRANGKRYALTGISDEQTAARVYDRLAARVLGSRATLNFPGEKPRPASVDELRRELRAARAEETSPSRHRTTSRHRGVYHDPAKLQRPWSARIEPNGALYFLGRYATERNAAIAYDRAARHYLGNKARLNLPAIAHKYLPADAEMLVFESRRPFKSRTTSRFVGVSWNGFSWMAKTYHRSRSLYLGSFAVEEEAAEAYDRAVLKIRGSRAKLNFDPRTGEELLGRVPARRHR